MVRWSKQFIPTLREVPAGSGNHKPQADAPGRPDPAAGRRASTPSCPSAGGPCARWKPIVREEMDRAGALEILMPALQPRELWERVRPLRGDAARSCSTSTDRQERALVLGPTHEEVVTELAAREISSYRQLPVNFYQIQTKFRDEIRPRFGLMRAKEFIMKDAYSFDVSSEAADTSYQAMYEAYRRIFAAVRAAHQGGGGGHRRHGRLLVARVHGPGRVRRGRHRGMRRLRLRRQPRARRKPPGRAAGVRAGRRRAERGGHARRPHHRGGGRVPQGPPRAPHQDPDLCGRRPTGRGPGRRRPGPERDQAGPRPRRRRRWNWPTTAPSSRSPAPRSVSPGRWPSTCRCTPTCGWRAPGAWPPGRTRRIRIS